VAENHRPCALSSKNFGLKALGLNDTYKIPGLEDAVHTGFVLDSGAAGIFNPRFTLTDQEVVLVRTDVPNFTVTSVSARTFVNDVTVDTLLGCDGPGCLDSFRGRIS